MAIGVIPGKGTTFDGFGNGDDILIVLFFEGEDDDGFSNVAGESLFKALVAFGNVFEFEVLGKEIVERVIADGIFANCIRRGGEFSIRELM